MATRKYRLNFGRFVDTDPASKVGEDGKAAPRDRWRDKIWTAGSVIETSDDLLKFNGLAGDARKFDLVDEGVVASGSEVWNPAEETLDDFVSRMKGRSGAPVPVAAAVGEED